MGLDCAAFRQIKRVEPQPDCEDTPDDMVRLYVNPDFPGRADDIQDGIYTYAAKFKFAAGSYSGYGEWRDQLAKFAGYKPIAREHSPYAAGAWAETGGLSGNSSISRTTKGRSARPSPQSSRKTSPTSRREPTRSASPVTTDGFTRNTPNGAPRSKWRSTAAPWILADEQLPASGYQCGWILHGLPERRMGRMAGQVHRFRGA